MQLNINKTFRFMIIYAHKVNGKTVIYILDKQVFQKKLLRVSEANEISLELFILSNYKPNYGLGRVM